MKLALVLSVTLLFAAARAKEVDVFDGLFGKPTFSNQEDIRGPAKRGVIGCRVSLLFPAPGPEWESARLGICGVAEKRLRAAGYKIVLSRSASIDTRLPATCNIVAERENMRVYFYSVASEAGPESCYLTYELHHD